MTAASLDGDKELKKRLSRFMHCKFFGFPRAMSANVLSPLALVA